MLLVDRFFFRVHLSCGIDVFPGNGALGKRRRYLGLLQYEVFLFFVAGGFGVVVCCITYCQYVGSLVSCCPRNWL